MEIPPATREFVWTERFIRFPAPTKWSTIQPRRVATTATYAQQEAAAPTGRAECPRWGPGVGLWIWSFASAPTDANQEAPTDRKKREKDIFSILWTF